MVFFFRNTQKKRIVHLYYIKRNKIYIDGKQRSKGGSRRKRKKKEKQVLKPILAFTV